eukprot:363061-Chlamydomonas_euryale.AAC.3
MDDSCVRPWAKRQGAGEKGGEGHAAVVGARQLDRLPDRPTGRTQLGCSAGPLAVAHKIRMIKPHPSPGDEAGCTLPTSQVASGAA